MYLGFLVNPIAGMGGRVGLKGTDGVVDEAIRRGAIPVAPGRAIEFLQALTPLVQGNPRLKLIVCPLQMGEDLVQEVGLEHTVIDATISDVTSSEDTRKCLLALYNAGVRLLAFVGGDGTARDILDVILEEGLEDLLVLGVPSGVKMYSGIFVVNPGDAAEVVRLVLDEGTSTADFEIMDADESAYREDRFVVSLYGYMKGPSVPARFQGSKQVSAETIDEHEAQEAIAKYIVEQMASDRTYILGPGTTVKTVTDLLGVKKTVLGVDVYHRGTMHNDVSETQIIELVDDFSKTWIIVSPIGHQGLLFGRGNQQISPSIIERVEREHIIVISTLSKLKGIESETLKVDTGDLLVDEMLRGYIRVVTDYRELRLIRVE